ncbi:MAG: cytochrome c oxidase subunit 3 [Acidobacteriota bacterium]
MAEARVEDFPMSEWDGGTLPYSVGHKKLGMWLFIISDALTFSGLLVGYSYLRVASPEWPTPFHLWPTIAMASVMTFALLSSSLTMVLGVNAAQRGDRTATVKWILFTILGGLLFILLHANEWRTLFQEGVTLFKNPWGTPLFGATFFGLTGMHMFHVFTGVLYLAAVALGVKRGRFGADHVEVCGLYWHFVDLVWMFIFPLVYLLSVRMH